MSKHTSTKPLRVAVVATNCLRIPPTPPEQYLPPGWSGAPETVVYQLVEGLVKKGHEVTLFASGDSVTNATLVSVTDQFTWKTKGIGPHSAFERMLLSKAYTMANQGAFDIIHSHLEIETLPFAPLSSTPTVSTLHSPIDTDKLHKDLLSHYKNTQYYVSISNSQRKPMPDLQYAGTVYNGIDVEQIPFSAKKEDYLLFAGRIVAEKGVAEAIDVAKATKQRLLIFGSADQTQDYWKIKIKPNIDGKQIVYHGMVPQKKLYEYSSHAKAVVFPLQWEEPFGLAIAEAMACGTPIITLDRGSMREIVEHNKSGFVVKTLGEMTDAIAHIEENFSIQAMIDGYETVYQNILAR